MTNDAKYSPKINLSNLQDHTEQEVFDFVVNHLRTQGEQSTQSFGCAYRGYNEDGDTLMCAAGCLIADDQYTEQMDNMDDTTWNALVQEDVVPDVYEDLIRQLQDVHDYCVSSWEEGFKRVAKRFNLVFVENK